MKLRGTQPLLVEKATAHLLSKSTKKQVFVAPVAYGKSICIAKIVSNLEGGVVVLQPNKELLEQNYSKYVNYGFEASICSASLGVKEVSKVTFATIGTVKSFKKELRDNNVKYVIIDECHLMTSTSSQLSKFLKELNIKNVIGLTATPALLSSSMQGTRLKIMTSVRGNIFTSIGHVVQVSEMVESGFWSPLSYELVRVDESKLRFNSSGTEFLDNSVADFYDFNKLETKCEDKVNQLVEEGFKSILIFVPNIDKAESLSRRIKGSKVIHSKMLKSDRNTIVNDFKDLKLKVLINVNILTTGFDHPELDAIIMARPTASLALYYQILGRITRIHPNKSFGKIVDYSGNVYKFGKIEHLNYEFIEGYGWGLFSKDTLLTNVEIASKNKPTKASLIKSSTVAGNKSIVDSEKYKLTFGKYKGKKLRDVPEGYLTFIMDNFNFETKESLELKHHIKTILKL